MSCVDFSFKANSHLFIAKEDATTITPFHRSCRETHASLFFCGPLMIKCFGCQSLPPGWVLSSDSLEPLKKNNRLFVLTFQSNYLFSAISGGMRLIQRGKIMYDERLSCLHLACFLTANDELMLLFCCAFYADRYHKSQAIYLESKDNTKISCVISSVGTNEVSFSTHPAPDAFRKTAKMRLVIFCVCLRCQQLP